MSISVNNLTKRFGDFERHAVQRRRLAELLDEVLDRDGHRTLSQPVPDDSGNN